ncbi:hypothetical protein [uncultured Methanobrevibacter sp.]|uniref:hypothetical protein n=1 Tax=uncultured Methanobrevibacter sp. TaxID=253161 RepID=UPI0025EEACBB|nr:hypothetical protein [uncultured Methanobrevibacter sp.]
MSNTKLLADTRHLLVSLSGLKAFDNLAEGVTSNDSHVSVNISELIPLDFSNEIQLIDEALKVDDSIDDSIMGNLCEWSSLVTEVSVKEVDLFNKKEAYNALSEEIIASTDFKALYGKNNESIRKQHCREELSEEYNEIKKLEFGIDYCKRRISFLKSLIRVKTVSMEIKE